MLPADTSIFRDGPAGKYINNDQPEIHFQDMFTLLIAFGFLLQQCFDHCLRLN